MSVRMILLVKLFRRRPGRVVQSVSIRNGAFIKALLPNKENPVATIAIEYRRMYDGRKLSETALANVEQAKHIARPERYHTAADTTASKINCEPSRDKMPG